MTQQKQCQYCQKTFTVKKNMSRRLYCSRRCNLDMSARRVALRGGRPKFRDCPGGSVGAISELLVCADLLAKGWEVFRAVSPNCSCDLIAHRHGITLRVEVRTAYIRKNGSFSLTVPSKKAGKFDVFARVQPGAGIIEYVALSKETTTIIVDLADNREWVGQTSLLGGFEPYWIGAQLYLRVRSE